MKLTLQTLILSVSFFLISFPTFSQFNSGVMNGNSGAVNYYGIIALPIVPDPSFVNFEIGSGSPITTGVDERLNEKWEVRVYPTTFTDRLTVQCSNTESRPFRLQIFDVLGNQIYLDQINNKTFRDRVELNTNEIQNTGLYFVKLISVGTNYSMTLKVIKVNNY